jgi:hypothetical protein
MAERVSVAVEKEKRVWQCRRPTDDSSGPAKSG